MGVSGIYAICCLSSGKLYIGSTNSLKRRWWEHSSLLRNGRHFNPILQAAWHKHGANSFVFVILEHVDLVSLAEKEARYICLLCPAYNLSKETGRTGVGHKQTEETKERISQ
jgi:group I intron endonuclease